jgi:hypothetical protein
VIHHHERRQRPVVHDDDTDVEVLARLLYALMWHAGRLVLAEPEAFPAKRLTAFAEQFMRKHFNGDEW